VSWMEWSVFAAAVVVVGIVVGVVMHLIERKEAEVRGLADQGHATVVFGVLKQRLLRSAEPRRDAKRGQVNNPGLRKK
jgi:hypothetical protein